MTTNDSIVRCNLCGAETEVTHIASTNSFGYADLDTRPPEMQRSTLFAWVQRCKGCGYCAEDITEPRSEAHAIIIQPEYEQTLNDPAYPELVNLFRCQSILCQETGDFATATWALIHAAWACDDAGKPEQAVECRLKAAALLRQAQENGKQISEQEGVDSAIMVDLLRRSRRMEPAKQVIEKARSATADDIIGKVLDFQSALITRNDVACHTIEEALLGINA